MAASHSSSYFASIASTLSLNLTRACESGSSCHTHRLRCGPCPLELPLLLVPCFHRHLWSRDRTRPWRCIDLNVYRYPRLKVSGSCMSSRSVALVNNLSPDVDNANTGYSAAREIVAPTPYIQYISILILCLCCVWLTIFRPLRVACWVDHFHWLSWSRRISSRAAHQ